MSAPMEIGQQPMMQSQEISKLEKSLSLIILISSKELKLLLRNSIDSEIIDQNYTYYSEEIEIEKILTELKIKLKEFDLINVGKVTLILNNKLSVLVPNDFFQEENCLDYLKFNSRLIVGTGKYKNMNECAKAIKISGAEIVTVAVRRVNISDRNKPLLMDFIDPKKITYLPNTAGCFNSEEALRTLRLAREIGGWKLVKLEVLGDKKKFISRYD